MKFKDKVTKFINNHGVLIPIYIMLLLIVVFGIIGIIKCINIIIAQGHL